MNDLRGLLKHLSSQTYANTCYMFQHPWINKEDQLKTPLQVRLYIEYRPLYSRMKRFPALLNSPMIQDIQSYGYCYKALPCSFPPLTTYIS